MIVFGIESSCDETSTAIVKDGKEILSHVISSQAQFHSKYGGVVPEKAARMHLETLPLLTKEAFERADLTSKDIDLIAVTSSPGLAPALFVGQAWAKGMAKALEIDLLSINHLDAHIYANSMSNEDLNYPHISLLVSGGHTQILLVKDSIHYDIIGSTVDDAVGEAYDKVARIFSLGYPGGPVIDGLYDEKRATVKFPLPMVNSNDYNFSFSGLKTAVRNYVMQNPNEDLVNIVSSFQKAAVEILVLKTIRAAKDFNVKTVTLAGGVSLNSHLRKTMSNVCSMEGFDFKFPDKSLCTDNAAMVAGFGCEVYNKKYARSKMAGEIA